MRFDPVDPPRRFKAGREAVVEMRDVGRLHLEPDEQVTFTTPAGAEYDVARKEWGFYATPSVDGRLPRFGLRACLATNGEGRTFVLLVERGCEEAFERYRAEHCLAIEWLAPAPEPPA